MAGQYARAKQRTGGLSGALQPVLDYFDKKRKQEEAREYMQRLYQTYLTAKQKQQGIGKTGLEPSTFEEGQGNVFDVKQKPQPETAAPDIQSTAGIETEVLGDYLPPQERMNRVQDEASDFTIEQIMNPSEYVDPQRINILGSALQKNADRLRPKERKIGTFNPEHDVVDETTGEIIRKGTKEQKQENILLPELSDFEADYYGKRLPGPTPEESATFVEGEGGIEDMILGDANQRRYEISKKDYRPKYTTDGDGGSGTGDPLDTYKFVENINKTAGKISEIDATLNNTTPVTTRYNKDTKKEENLPEPLYWFNGKQYTKGELQAVKSRYEQELKGGSDSMVKYLEENRYPGLTRIVNELWNDIKGASPQQINKIIGDKLKNREDFKKLPESMKQDLLNSLSAYFKSRKY